MKLIYAWFEKDKRGIFADKGIHLTDEYSVEVARNKKGKIYIVDIKKNEDYISIFENNVISDVTAIVGQNGSGKTTLLEALYDLTQFEHDVTGFWIYDCDKHLEVYSNMNNNFEMKKFESKNNIQIFYRAKEVLFNANTNVFLTNSSFNSYIEEYSVENGENVYTTHFRYDPNIMNLLAKKFYTKGIGAEALLFEDLQRILVIFRTEQDFQKLCNALLFRKLIELELFDEFSKHVPTDLKVECDSLEWRLAESFNNTDLNIKKKFQKKYYKLWEVMRGTNEDINIADRLKLNWIFEIAIICSKISILNNKLNKFKSKKNSDNLLNHSPIDMLFNYVKNKLPEYVVDLEDCNYYERSYEEIIDFINILKVDYSEKSVVLSWYKNKQYYTQVSDFISLSSKRKTSFVLKYINISLPGLSSGENAYLNIYSWLHLISFFPKKMNNIVNFEFNENILIFIDEIDLYCHPEWQRVILCKLLNMLSLEYAIKNKKIQLIFTTHSPIALSDIPRTNTIYLQRNRNEYYDQNFKYSVKILSGVDIKKESFAANIYTLFDDAFFLSGGTVGEYAANTINEVYRQMKIIKEGGCNEEISNSDLMKKVKFIIHNTGDSLIKRRLQIMYEEAFYKEQNSLKSNIYKKLTKNVSDTQLNKILEILN